jgi:sugar lactone lactonase YvrE
VVDLDGTLWNARWGEGRITAYRPDGSLLGCIATPVGQPTCPAFVGKTCDRLAVTSAWAGLDESQRAAQPDAGMTFLLYLPVRGRFEPRVLI